ncbi:MAG: flagellar export protein FliJ [Akkermansiaceae bacterium]|nr:flagellar export protein FliJ [Verrucomicrobiales bacterium]
MKPFRFSLQPLRVIREQKEQKAQKAFGDALRLCDEAAFQLQASSDELVAAWTTLCREVTKGVNASEIMRSRSWCNVLELRQKDHAEALQQAQRSMEAALLQMRLATRDREAIDNYHDKRRGVYDLEVQRDEQKNLDEVGLRRTGAGAGFSQLHRTNSL